jgi:hypothetical protein
MKANRTLSSIFSHCLWAGVYHPATRQSKRYIGFVSKLAPGSQSLLLSRSCDIRSAKCALEGPFRTASPYPPLW